MIYVRFSRGEGVSIVRKAAFVWPETFYRFLRLLAIWTAFWIVLQNMFAGAVEVTFR